MMKFGAKNGHSVRRGPVRGTFLPNSGCYWKILTQCKNRLCSWPMTSLYGISCDPVIKRSIFPPFSD